MLPQTVKVGAGRTSVDVVLSEDMIGLEDVVVTGYTTMKRKDITGSVSSISADRIERIPAYNITTALTGIAGIRMDGGSIRIRGTRSRNASNDPLIVLDGIPYDETLASINPGDIESIDVLKDASSTAIYGARGANGVILITTKQARQGKTTVTYDGFVGAGVNNWGSLDVMDADEYIAFQREASRAAGTWHSEADDAKAFFGIELANMGKVDNDWMGKYFNKKRLWTSHSLTISAATDKSAYKIAFNYKNEDSRYKNAGHDHFYLTADLSHKVLPFLKVGLSSRAYYIVKNDKPDMFNQFLHMSPLTQTRNEDGSYNVYPFGDPFVKNPYMNESDDVYKDKTEEWKLFLRFFAQIDLAKGLTFNTNFAYSPAFSSRGYYYDNRSVSYTDERNVAFMHNNRKADWVWNNVLSYKRQFDRHNIDLTAVYEMQNRQTVNASMSGKDQESPAYLWYNMGRLTDSKSLSSGFVRSQMVSVVGRVQYSYDDRYIVTASFREDGASQLSPGHKWAFSPTISAAWVLSEEKWLKDVSWVNFLKLRASFGVINVDYLPKDGSTTVYDYWDQIYTTTGTQYKFNSSYDSEFGSTIIGRLATANSTHEKAYKYNVGVDAVLFNGLDVTAEGYYQRRKDIWVSSEGKYTDVLGVDAPFENAGIVDSYGVELGLNYTKRLGDVVFNLGGNFAWNKNEIKEQLEEPRLYKNLVQTGNRLGQVYGMVAEGFFKDKEDIANSLPQNFSTVVPGDIKYKDVNGDGIIDANDKTAIGYSTTAPEIYYSFHLGAEWKGIGVDVMFQGTGNYSAVLNTKSMFWPLINNTTLSTHYYENRWTPENQNAKYPRLSSQSNANNYQANTVWLADRSFLKLRNAEVYYRFPEEWMKKTKILGSAKLYVRGTDLFCSDHIDVTDPECYGVATPLNKSVVVGVTIGF